MIEVTGKYGYAKIFTNNVEKTAVDQIITLLDQEFLEGAKVRIMPDTHAGAGCVIGFTADLGNKVIPNLVGVDIGCGMLVVKLGNSLDIDLEKLDSIIHDNIPFGRDVHSSKQTDYERIKDLICFRELKGDYSKFVRGIGSLGGGNHFIEVDIDDEGNYYLVIHSGSRNLGKQVAEYYQDMAIENCKGLGNLNKQKQALINGYKLQGHKDLIQNGLANLEREFKNTQPVYPKDLCFLVGDARNDYLFDMEICQRYAYLNRYVMADIILDKMFGLKTEDFEYFQTIHNYISFDDNVIRKGAVSAYYGEELIIPINMRDGSILAHGKGNQDYNFSAPHGAGRLMGRNEAMRRLSMQDFEDSMKGIYSTTVNRSTLDEAPMAYKPMQEIIDNIQDTVTIDRIIKPVYNFKASE